MPSCRPRPRMTIASPAFLGFVLLNAVLMCIGIKLWFEWGPRTPDWLNWWMWTFAAPAWAIRVFQNKELFWTTIWINPVLYGAIWWLMWRFARVMRSKLSSDDTAH